MTKEESMKRKFLMLVFTVFFVIKIVAQSTPTIKIVNNTGENIIGLYIRKSNTSEWGGDIINGRILLDGEFFAIPQSVYPFTLSDRYDIKLVDDSDTLYLKENVLLYNNISFEFTSNDFSDENYFPSVPIKKPGKINIDDLL
jgi:hypothetical protein